MSQDPTHIGRYAIEATLGRGAMGAVYRAHDPEIDRKLAIKLIHADLLSGEERDDFVARFRREAQAAGRCAHPNIVAVYDFALHEGNPFLAMEFIDGTSLAQAHRGSARMPADRAVGLIRQVLAGLGAAHAAGIVHRDIKPANIMLTRTGTVKVADFGISRIDTSALTSHGMVIGTPSYMSPEQCRGETVDARSDLFSVGVVLYELLAGAKPFAGRSAAELYAKLLTEAPPDLATTCPDLPAALCGAVARSLAKNPAERFRDADAMAAALQAAVAEDLGDRTIAQPNRPAQRAAATSVGSFDPQIIETIERNLAQHLGPIARHLVQSAVRKAPDLDALCAALAANIESQPAREQFERTIRSKARSGSTGLGSTLAPTPALTQAELDRLQTELARHLGPVARVLIKRALPGAGSAGALWRDLATHIEAPADRDAFLRKAPP